MKSISKPSTYQESRSSRFNVPVRHPSKWQVLLDQVLASPMRIHRYRNLSIRTLENTFENTLDQNECRRQQ